LLLLHDLLCPLHLLRHCLLQHLLLLNQPLLLNYSLKLRVLVQLLHCLLLE
jgi:hypothetical protein